MSFTKLISEILHNKPIICALLCWFSAQLAKMIITAAVEHTLDPGKLLAPGGMPSSHTAFVTGVAVTVGVQEGFDSVFFALAAAFAIVIMYDACGVRRAVGNQAKALNNIINLLNANDTLANQEAVREILGHTPLQVLIGMLLGLAIALIFNFVLQGM